MHLKENFDGVRVEIDEDGSKFWLSHGELHRLDGPAVEYADGTKEWWVFGNQVSEQDFPQAVIVFLYECYECRAQLTVGAFNDRT